MARTKITRKKRASKHASTRQIAPFRKPMDASATAPGPSSVPWVSSPWEAMVKNFEDATKMVPDDWQVQPGINATIKRIDTVLLAATGAGKTIPQVIAAYWKPSVSIIMLMPLNELEKLQMSAFRKWKLDAHVFNSETATPELRKRIRKRNFQVLCTSPEMMDSAGGLRELASHPDWGKDLVMVVDEAHCIPRWKDSFRKTYGRIGSFRAYLPHKVPFIACTATATPEDVRIICEILQLGADTDIINRGNHRKNLLWEVRHMKGAETSLEDVDFMVPDGVTRADEIEQQLLFANRLITTHNLAHRLRQRLPPHLRGCIEIYHSLRTVHQRAWTMYNFDCGKTRIIVCSEAIAMGCDFRNITRVVQFMITDSLTTWIQRGGRGGRNPDLTCRCILLVQPSVFQLVKPRKKRKKKAEKFEDSYAGPLPDSALPAAAANPPTLAALDAAPEPEAPPSQPQELDGDINSPEDDDEDDEIVMVNVVIDAEDSPGDVEPVGVDTATDDTTPSSSTPAGTARSTGTAKAASKKATVKEARVYAKKIPKDLRAFVSTKECRNTVIDATYMNPAHAHPPSGCCDLCIARKDAAVETVAAAADPDMQHSPHALPPDTTAPATQLRKEPGMGDRRGAQLDAARTSVGTWRYSMWKRDMRWSSLGEAAILSDADMQLVCKKRCICDALSLERATPSWAQRDKYASGLLAVLATIAKEEEDVRAAAHRQRDAERAVAHQAKEALRQLERDTQVAERQATRGPTKAAMRQAERDAQASAGIKLRGRPTKIELARRVGTTSGEPVAMTPLRAQGMSAASGMATPQSDARVPHLPDPPFTPLPRQPLAQPSSATPTPSTPRTDARLMPYPLFAPFRPSAALPIHTPIPPHPSHGLLPAFSPTLHRPRNAGPQPGRAQIGRLAFQVQATPQRTISPAHCTPSNFVVVPLAEAAPRVLVDSNGRKRSAATLGNTPDTKRTRVDSSIQ
ncbi:P-loop containing nucleoside triphosphate hydrolase protein [Auricularia subglabra TFB-10046 SS5]|nr:P-loop containing nucleoside triphosphate hydrolase protein [Auricularia subglabra TFB-10046 SS5]